MKLIGRIAVAFALTAGASAAHGQDRRPLATVEFFGYKGLDVAAVRAALPFQEGEMFPPPKVHSDQLKQQVAAAIKRVIGKEPTDVAFVCCDDKQRYGVYIGLPGASYAPLAFDPPPTGAVRLPKEAMKVSEAADAAWEEAIKNGRATEDDSAGYALSNDPRARKAQLALRDYALHHEDVILTVLTSSSDENHRAAAAQMLGYGRQSQSQIDALVHASFDNDEDVRNNAVRALEVLARAKPELARAIPPQPFIRLMRSGSWLDRNKASLVLDAITETRDPTLLDSLRSGALDQLIEMGRWRSSGHAEAALSVLGRLAGIEEDSLKKMIESGRGPAILAKFGR
jgi:hypothetical protein